MVQYLEFQLVAKFMEFMSVPGFLAVHIQHKLTIHQETAKPKLANTTKRTCRFYKEMEQNSKSVSRHLDILYVI